jgi:hypothetical protein
VLSLPKTSFALKQLKFVRLGCEALVPYVSPLHFAFKRPPLEFSDSAALQLEVLALRHQAQQARPEDSVRLPQANTPSL